MSLYSNSLCGLVLLTDSRVQCVAGVEGELAGLAMRSTEFHFPTLEQQLEGVRSEVKRSSSWRTDYWAKKAAAEAALGGGDGMATGSKRDFSALNTGDFYLTRHSNLCETHVVFHMVVDDTLDNINISSRHPVIMGLRNVLKTACLNDITSLTVPLLLGHHMTEKMTVPWCLRRWARKNNIIILDNPSMTFCQGGTGVQMLERFHDGDGRLGWFRDQDPSVPLTSLYRPGRLLEAHSHAVDHLQGVLRYQGLNWIV